MTMLRNMLGVVLCLLVLAPMQATASSPDSNFDIDVQSGKALRILTSNRQYSLFLGFLNLKTCKPCQTVNEAMPEIRKRLAKKDVVFAHTDILKFSKLASKFEITRTPTFAYVIDGELFGSTFNPVRRDGSVNMEGFVAEVERLHTLGKKFRRLKAEEAQKAYEIFSLNLKLKKQEEIIPSLEEAAKVNHPLSQMLLAKTYKSGAFGQKKSISKCMYWTFRAQANNNVEARSLEAVPFCKGQLKKK
ncbi:MAG: thioredoxin family protein [Sneathiellales bacterium]|nr:thioredoxin family protein [Sneathiellales bacterium]